MPKIVEITSCRICPFLGYHDDASTFCEKTNNELPDPYSLPKSCQLEDAPGIEKLQAENARLREALDAIRDYGTDGNRSVNGYPAEIAYDKFAYRRMVDAYREAAEQALEDNK